MLWNSLSHALWSKVSLSKYKRKLHHYSLEWDMASLKSSFGDKRVSPSCLSYPLPFPPLPPLFIIFPPTQCKMQTADCRLQTRYKMQTADCRLQTRYKMQTADCRLQTRYKMQTENLNCFFIGYIITSNLTIYRASLNRFSAIIVHDDLHYCGIFLACFLITIVLDIISSLHIVF